MNFSVNTIYLLLLSFILILFSCKKKDEDTTPSTPKSVQANFSAKQYHADEIDFLFEFVNSSENAARFEWTFGDGTESVQFEPNHIYEDYGTYEVKLFAFDKNNNVSTKTVIVTYGPHLVSKVIIDSIKTFDPNYIDTFADHYFHLNSPINSSRFDLDFNQLAPLEFTSDHHNIDLNYWDTSFEVEIRHNEANLDFQCSYFSANNVLSKILTTESLNHSLEFVLVDQKPCEAKIISMIYARIEVGLKL